MLETSIPSAWKTALGISLVAMIGIAIAIPHLAQAQGNNSGLRQRINQLRKMWGSYVTAVPTCNNKSSI